MKKRTLNNSYSSSILGVPIGNAGNTFGVNNNNNNNNNMNFSTTKMATNLTNQGGLYNQSQKSMSNSFYSHRAVSIGEPRKKRNLGVTLSKLELPARLVQQKELFNEMGGWLTSTSKHREILLSQQSGSKRSNQSKLNTPNIQIFNPNATNMSNSLLNFESQNSKRPNFYDHKNIFRVKDFKPLKNNEEKIAQSVDDPISIAQRRILIQEFELKVQQFLKILNIKKELGARSYEKFYRNIESSIGGLNSLSLQSNSRINSNPNQSIQNSYPNINPYQINNKNNKSLDGNIQININPMISEKQQSTSIINNSISKNIINQTNNQNYPTNVDSVISTIPPSKRLSLNNNNPNTNSGNQTYSIQQVTQRDLSNSSNNNNTEISQSNQSQNINNLNKASFIDRVKDIEWQYNTYYQINQHQFQELSEKQLSYLTTEEREQYQIVLNHFKSIGHRFQVQVIVQPQQQQQNESNDYLAQTQGNYEDSNSNIPQSSQQQQRLRKLQVNSSQSTSRIALHQRLQDYILEQCKNYLNSDATNYDEKLRIMKKQYEIMLDNFEKKSHKVWLPQNVRPRNQDFNDYYIIDDSANNINNLQKQIFQDITEENFGSILSINLDLIDGQNENNENVQNERIEEEDDVPDEADNESSDDQNNDNQENDDDDYQSSYYSETPYSQKKARNKKKLIKIHKDSPAHYKVVQEPVQQQQKKKKKQPQITNVQDQESQGQKSVVSQGQSDQSEDNDDNFTRQYNNKYRNSVAQNSPQTGRSSRQMKNKNSNSPQSNRNYDSENEDKFEENKDQSQNPKKNQGRSQFSKKAQPPSQTTSKREISINDIKNDNSINPDEDNNNNNNNNSNNNNDYNDNAKTPKSIEVLSSSSDQGNKQRRKRKNSDDSGGFEQAKDELEDLNEYKRSSNNNRKMSISNNDVNSDRDTSIRKITNITNPSDQSIILSKKNISNQDNNNNNNNKKQSNRTITKDRSYSNASVASSQSIQNSSQQIKKNEGQQSSFKQKIQNEIRMEEELKNKNNKEEYEIVKIGTGLFDRILQCNNYMDFDVNKYFKTKKKVVQNPNVKHKTELDRITFTKLTQWEYEVNEENENYSETMNNRIDLIVQIQSDINESKNKKRNNNNQNNTINNNNNSSFLRRQGSIANSSFSSSRNKSSSQSGNNQNSQDNIDSVIEQQNILPLNINDSYDQDQIIRDLSPSIGRGISKSISENNNSSGNGSAKNLNSSFMNKSNYGNNNNNNEMNRSSQSINKNKAEFHLNLSNINQNNFNDMSPQQIIKLKMKTQVNESSDEDEDLSPSKKKPQTSESENSSKSSSSHELI